MLVTVRVVLFATSRENARAILDDQAGETLGERRDYLDSRLEDIADQANPGGQFGGEWVLVTVSMTAIATANLAFAYPDSVPRARTILARCREVATSRGVRAFDTERWGTDALEDLESDTPHIGYLGHLALVLEAERILGGPTDARERPVIAALRRRLDRATAPILETYPGERYVADNVVVAAALAMSTVASAHDPERAATSATVARFVAWARVHLVDAHGALVFRTDAKGEAEGPARGSGIAWSSIYLPFVDPSLAEAQARVLRDRYRKSFGPLGGAVCEYDGCAAGHGDVDSGPVLLGTSPSGSGFALAAAKTLDDEAWLSDLLALDEWVGLTIATGAKNQTKRRFLFAPLVGDAIVLAALTTRAPHATTSRSPWDTRYLSR